MDLAKRAEMSGPQEWLAFYFKSPMMGNGRTPEHELSKQLITMQQQLRRWAGASSATAVSTG